MYSLTQYPHVQQVTANVRHADTDASRLFHEALRDPSNLEMDWLWLATQVTRESEQSYCLRQALRINPHSEPAQHGLAQLQRQPGNPIDFQAWAHRVFWGR
ncbi:MAG TPA: hypothetical protein VKE41_20625 [Roseiflexaceae bacterium]|nr:hypothetical protein [Roseiflexaceae bacterium]